VDRLLRCVLYLADFFEGDPTACNLGEDGLGGGSPDIGSGVVVVGVDVFLDGGEEVGHGVEDPAPQCFVGQITKPAFDEVEPRRRCRGEVEVEPGVFVQPLADVFVLVGGVVVQDQVVPVPLRL
jgi:hypothetical protein